MLKLILERNLFKYCNKKINIFEQIKNNKENFKHGNLVLQNAHKLKLKRRFNRIICFLLIFITLYDKKYLGN